MKKLLALALLILSTATGLNAQSFESEINSLILSVFNDKNEPGAVFMLAKDGNPSIKKHLVKPIWNWT